MCVCSVCIFVFSPQQLPAWVNSIYMNGRARNRQGKIVIYLNGKKEWRKKRKKIVHSTATIYTKKIMTKNEEIYIIGSWIIFFLLLLSMSFSIKWLRLNCFLLFDSLPWSVAQSRYHLIYLELVRTPRWRYTTKDLDNRL